jgi:hypothetical protein
VRQAPKAQVALPRRRNWSCRRASKQHEGRSFLRILVRPCRQERETDFEEFLELSLPPMYPLSLAQPRLADAVHKEQEGHQHHARAASEGTESSLCSR